MQCFTPGGSKIEVFETYFFFDNVITLNDHPRYAKHVLGRIHVFFTLFGCWARRGGGGGGWRSPKGFVHNLPMQFFTPDSSKVEVLETFFLIP